MNPKKLANGKADRVYPPPLPYPDICSDNAETMSIYIVGHQDGIHR